MTFCCCAGGASRRTAQPQPADPHTNNERSRHKMKKIGFATLVSSGLIVAILGLGVPPALAVTPGDGQRVLELVAETKMGVDHLEWLNDIRPKVNVPMVDTSVQQ